MRPSIDQLGALAAKAVPTLERELGKLRELSCVEPELRLRMYGACTITSEIFRQRFARDGLEPGLLFRELPEPLVGGHTLLVLESSEGLAVMDSTYGQLFEPFGPSWTEAKDGRPVRFPDDRVLVFLDGQQDTVAEWATEVVKIANPRADREAAYTYFRSIWDLDEYRGHTAGYYTRRYAGRVGGQLWSENGRN